MTTAHRPTFDPARGKETLHGPAYHQRLLPAHTHLKFRQAGQGGAADEEPGRDLAAELLAAEAAHFAKTVQGTPPAGEEQQAGEEAGKRRLSAGGAASEGQAKRLRVLQSTRALDADDESGPDASSDNMSDSDNDDDDEDAELQRELERVRRERAEKKQREEAARAKEQQEARERDIALGNPLLNKPDFSIKRRWDDDVVFRNQARGTEDRGKKEFVNDLLRSDFHRRFMSKYIR